MTTRNMTLLRYAALALVGISTGAAWAAGGEPEVTMKADDKTATAELAPGMPAPAFAMVSDKGDMVSLADFRGKQHVVLFFYPKDMTSGCTAEACAFRDLAGEMRGLGAVVLGVSPDDRASHEKFSTAHQLNFPLLVDEGAKVAQAYGVWKEKTSNGRTYLGIERSTFLIDKQGIVRRAWCKVKVEGHDDEVLAALKEL